VQIRHFESDEKSNSLRKEYLALEKAQQGLKKDADALREELEIASLDPKEANAKFTARVNDFKAGAKRMEEKATQVRACCWCIQV
jgi:predicted  nucleic acid-binding Zn-ribbon protein